MVAKSSVLRGAIHYRVYRTVEIYNQDHFTHACHDPTLMSNVGTRPRCLTRATKVLRRLNTQADTSQAHITPPNRTPTWLNAREFQAVGSCAAVQANIAVLGMAGTKSAVDVVASSSGRRRSGNYHRQGEPRAAWGRLTHDLPANNFCSHVHHVPDAGKARRTPPMPSQRRPRSSAEMHAAGGTREGDSKTGNSDTERTGFRVDSSGDDQQSESWIPAGGGGTDGVRGDVTPMMGSSPPPPYVSAPPAYLEVHTPDTPSIMAAIRRRTSAFRDLSVALSETENTRTNVVRRFACLVRHRYSSTPWRSLRKNLARRGGKRSRKQRALSGIVRLQVSGKNRA